MSPPSKQSPRQVGEDRQAALLARIAPRLKHLVEEIVEIDRQISNLKDQRAIRASERDHIRKIMYETPTFERRNGTGQGLYVHTRYFMPYVEQWITKYDEEHGKGGLTAVSRKAAIAPKTVRSYRNESITYAGIMSVDRLLSAMDREDLMEDMPWKTTTELKIGGRDQSKQLPEPPPTKYYEE